MPVCPDCLGAPKPLEADYFCSGCRTPFLNPFPLDENGVCAACRSGLRGFDGASSFGFYEGALRDLIHLFKYAGMRPLGGRLTELLAQALPVDQQIDLVTAVPLHWRKKWRRGFNQSEILARGIARLRGIPYLETLRRVRHTGVQAGLAKTARRRNATGAFQAARRADVHGKRVLLVDDVMTTGATAAACGLELKRAGAKSVSLLTLARVDRRWKT